MLNSQTYEIECIEWCPSCQADICRVYRKPTRQEGVFTHFRSFYENRGTDDSGKKCADCGETLCRNPVNGTP